MASAPRHHLDWVDTFVKVLDAKTEAPPNLLFWTAVATLGGAITRRVWIEEVIFRLYANKFIVFVAPPGIATKSTTINHGIKLLKELDHIYLAADNTTYAAFIRDLARRQSELRTLIDDHAPEDDLWIRQCAVTAALTEFGTFFKPEDEDMVNGLTKLWDCESILVKDTKDHGTDVVEHPFVNLIAGTTTSWIKDKVKTQLGGWGFSSRVIFVYCPAKTKYIPRPSKNWTPGEFERLTTTLLDDLRTIANLEGEAIFSPAADQLAHDWYIDHSHKMVGYSTSNDPDPWLGYFLARKQAHVHKLAMILSCSRRNTLVIEEHDFLDAVAKIDEVQHEIPIIFKADVTPTYLARVEQECLKLITNEITKDTSGPTGEGQILRSKAFHRVSSLIDSGNCNRMIDNAIVRGDLKQIVDKGKTWLKLP